MCDLSIWVDTDKDRYLSDQVGLTWLKAMLAVRAVPINSAVGILLVAVCAA
ncbi:hypothetical protein [Levilactobacillus fuyuanensis]|uniref:Uncharacterized protein n=1 Tax=Levilactobacillus fuyuanensis TaxID=2486022 RepID=A0ABW4H297_9LACO|nr:hypothetical protein [Levilactobacillus fuyuanensis]